MPRKTSMVGLEPSRHGRLGVLAALMNEESPAGSPHIGLGDAVQMAMAEAFERRGYPMTPEEDEPQDQQNAGGERTPIAP